MARRTKRSTERVTKRAASAVPGSVAHTAHGPLHSCTVGALPIVNDLLARMRRIQALLCLYFFALLVEALLERELRQAMQRKEIEASPMYPEGRACRWPTARRLLDLFEPVQRHALSRDRKPGEIFVTELTSLQCRLRKLLGLSPQGYGH